jgi:O-acetyl-ADP-ribose deacetylase (regulator of RNase III)/ADP-ribosylglycohydrolase
LPQISGSDFGIIVSETRKQRSVKSMYGAILGDMVGAPYEFDRGDKTKNFEFWNSKVGFTDDSVMSIAVADALMRAGREGTEHEIKDEVVKAMQKWGRKYPYAGYGGKFAVWLREYNPKPYGSYGNGSAMRVSAVGWLYDSLERTREVVRWTAEVTHNHPEGVKGAEATASAIYMARNGASKEEIKNHITENYGYDLTRTCDEIRPTYHHVESCQGTVPEAMTAFLEGNDFEDVIRTAVSLGGDCDTLTCIAGGIAEAFYGVPLAMEAEVKSRLTEEMLRILEEFDELRGRIKPKNELKFFVGDITQLPVDAIVNAANSSLLGGGGVDGAIHRAAGRELLEECRTLHGCRTGEAKITKGYRLPAKHVIHTVGPIYSGTHTDEEDLYRCYYNSLGLAAKNHLYSIAFPGISTGVYGYPKEEAAQVALTAILNWFDANEDYGMQVVVVNFSNADYEVYKKVIDNAKEGR